MAFALSSSSASTAFQSLTSLHSSDRLHMRPSSLLLSRHFLATSTIAFSRRRNHNSTVTSSSKKKKKSVSKKEVREEDEIDEDAFEALFGMLEEDLKSDDLSMGDGDDEDGDLSEKDLEKLQRELEEALGVGGDDDDEVEMISSVGYDVEDDDGEEEEEEERPAMIKNWQLRRLARVLKIGRRKTGIKSLAAELCLDRAVVLDLLRDPPPNLVMMSAALPDEPAPSVVMPETKPSDIVFEETTDENVVKSESEMKLPVHVMQDSWFARKRLKRVHAETLERVYRRTKRPTNTMISSIVHVTNLPRKRVVKWFEDKRAEEGVPDNRNPFQRSVPETVSSS
ncbi:HOMEOBOX PROTEIN 8 [Salix viminalis]|uniref:HOMEOBOX PROTEIN 8 n=1 Tax=Salix viminalis TaxID=40686 RepID=A0A9Q0V7S1_SALVM|nr:HOMEOBOX PROTEIN 8 [Salix viminalis]